MIHGPLVAHSLKLCVCSPFGFCYLLQKCIGISDYNPVRIAGSFDLGTKPLR